MFSGKIEMGQGVTTSLAQMAAEELGVGLESIDMVMGDTDLCVWDAGTYGSLTTRMFGPALRTAAAEAKAMLLQLAAERLGVPKAQLTAGNGNVWVTDQKTRSVSYAELAKGQALARKLDEKAVLRSVKEFQTMGRSPLRIDGKDKVTGAAKYAADIRIPGMLYARILRPPAHGATLVKADTANAAKASGVTLVNEDGMIAVLHEHPDAAERALETIKAEWTTPEPGADQDGIFDELLKKAPEPETIEARGDTAAARSAAAKLVRAHVPQGLRRARADGAARGDRRNQGRQGDDLGLDADAVPDPRPPGPGPGHGREERPRDHALRRRRLRREVRRKAGRGSGHAGQDHGTAGAGRVDPRGGVLLRHVRSRLDREGRPQPSTAPGRSRSGSTTSTSPAEEARSSSTTSRTCAAGTSAAGAAPAVSRTASASARGAGPART